MHKHQRQGIDDAQIRNGTHHRRDDKRRQIGDRDTQKDKADATDSSLQHGRYAKVEESAQVALFERQFLKTLIICDIFEHH